MKPQYIFNGGRIARKDNTLVFHPVDADGKPKKKRYLPIERVDTLYNFGSLDMNSAILNFFGQKKISIHFFDYYNHYTGSFVPKEARQAGKVQVAQTETFLKPKRRLYLAQKIIEGAMANMLRILKYRKRATDLQVQIDKITHYQQAIPQQQSIPQLMGLEGNARKTYYSAFDAIIQKSGFKMGGRSKQPPKNEVNALISFGNMMCYTLCLDFIYHTALNPTISFLHEPGARRFSLALDLAEIFKPILVDKVMFTLLNRRQLQNKHFDDQLNGCYLNERGKKIWLEAFEKNKKQTVKHRNLKKQVRYSRLILLECHKIQRHILDGTGYEPFKMWW